MGVESGCARCFVGFRGVLG